MQLLNGAHVAVWLVGAGIASAAPVFVRWLFRRDCALMAMPVAKEVQRRLLLGSEALAVWVLSIDMITALPGLGWLLAIWSMGLAVLVAYLLGSAGCYRWIAIRREADDTSTNTNQRGETGRD